MQCDQFIGNGYPALRHPSSNPDAPPPFATAGQAQAQTLPMPKPRRKRRKKAPREDPRAANETLLGLINKNITTMRHLRVTHSRFSSLKETKEATNDEGGLALPGPSASFGGPPEPLDFSGGPILTNLEPLSNINPWSRRLDEDCDYGPREAENCLHWVGEKVLEHAGFQGRNTIYIASYRCLSSYQGHRR
jgi:transcriptional activator SPT7